MIKSIAGYGFEAYDEFFIELHKGLNVVTGPSDSGKSSVIKLLSWIAKNRPRGDGFRNNELAAKDIVSGEIVFIDDSWVVREKSKTINEYLISTEKDPLKALRADVPNRVKNLTRLKSVNIQRQHPEDQYFLLLDSPGVVAKKFNKVIGLEAMGEAVKNINGKVSVTNYDIKHLDESIKNHEDKIKALNWLKEAEKDMKALFVLKEYIQNLNDDTEDIEELVVNSKEIQNKLDTFRNLPSAEKELEELFSKIDTTEILKKEKSTLENAILSIKNIDLKIKSTNTLKDAENDFLSIENKLNELKKLKEKWTNLDKVVSMLNLIENRIESFNKEIDKMEKILEKELKVCPLCGRKD